MANPPKRSMLSKKVHKWIRRTHMYFGIALLPWVILYGVTALLFNHSSWMSKTEVSHLAATPLHETPLADLPGKESIARDAMAQLSEQAGIEFEIDSDSLRWVGSFSFNGKSPASGARLSVDPLLRGASLRRWPVEDHGQDPAWMQLANGEFEPKIEVPEKQLLAEAAARLVPSDPEEPLSWEVRRLPAVAFEATVDGVRYPVEVSLSGQVEVEAPDQPTPWRSRLLRLHVQHGYPGYEGARQIWAMVVDLMGAIMVFWGISGAIMWWSIRKTRLLGMIALGAGVLAMAVMAGSVWHLAGL